MIVAFVPIKFVVFVVTKFEVEALVVEAFEVAKLEVVPQRVVMFASVEFNVEIIPAVKLARVAKKLVEVVLSEIKLLVKVLVWVALVIVAKVANKLTNKPVVEPEASSPHSKSEVEALYINLSVAKLQAPRPAPDIFAV